jgi:FkbM family methyltransferase
MKNGRGANIFLYTSYRVIFKITFILASIRDAAIFCYRKTQIYIKTKIFNKGKRAVIFKIHKNRMLLSLDDSGISRELMLHRTREPVSTGTLKSILKKGDVVLDIGANIGYYALMEAHIVGENGKVYACEPVPDTFKILKKNTRLNGFRNIALFKQAFADENKEVDMYVSSKSNIAAMIKRVAHDKGRIKVSTITVDDFLKDKETPSFLRMDVEGYETEIIKGMSEVLKNNALKNIFIEIHFMSLPVTKSVELLSTLKKNGFEVNSSAPDAAYWLRDKLWRQRIGPSFAGYTIDDFIEQALNIKLIMRVFFTRRLTSASPDGDGRPRPGPCR